MKIKQIVMNSLLSAVILASGAAFAERPGRFGQQTQGSERAASSDQQGFMSEGPAFARARLAMKLQLTTEQREQIKTIHQDARELAQPVVDQIVLNRQQISELVKAEPYDTAQVQVVADAQGGLYSQLIVIRANAKAAVYSVLSEEQKAIFEEQRPNGSRPE